MNRQLLDLAIVTSCHNYGRYVVEWAKSIVALKTFYPSVCTIIDNGSTDTSPHQIEEAAKVLRAAGINTIVERIPFESFGRGRNKAVEASGDTTWVMHFDCDDTLMDHALEDTHALMPEADVIGFGYRRSGDLASGPRNRTRVYSKHQGKSTLDSNAPCSGVSPFRRSFWERSPYREEMRGGWDTALWIGFAHLNARFVPTRRPVFFYRQHHDSIFNQRWPNKRRTHFVGCKLGNLRRKFDRGVSVIIPFRPDRAERDLSYDWVKRRYEGVHPDWEVVTGYCPDDEPWRKGVAVADALTRANGATLVIADSDCFIEPDALTNAVELVSRGQAEWVVPHTLVKRLDKESSVAVIGQDPCEVRNPEGTLRRKSYEGYAGGGLLVVDRSDYEAAGGIPHVFVGWGAEDECLAVVLDTLIGEHTRFEYDLWHLYHSPTRRMRDSTYTANRSVLRLFMDYADDLDGMWDFVQHIRSGGVPTEAPSGRSGGVIMQAVETFKRGTQLIKAGEVFRAEEDEARRHETRPRKMAKRFNGSASLAAQRTQKERTLDIRAQQAERNADIAERNLRRRQLMET